MAAEVVLISGLFDRTGRLRQVLDLLATVREIEGSLTEREGLRGYVELVLRFAELFGLESEWIERLRGVLENDASLDLLLALVRFAANWMGRLEKKGGGDLQATSPATVEAAALAEWLPLVLWLLETWRQLRGTR